MRSDNWNDLPEIDLLPALSSDDEECLSEIKQIIIKHGKEKMFGITLLHKHFDLNDDEVLFETQDDKNKTLTLRARKISELQNQGIAVRPTTWRFDKNGVLVYTYCPGSGPYGRNITSHFGYKDPD